MTDNQNQIDESTVPLKTLPKALQPYYSLEQIKSNEITLEEKTNLVKVYGKQSKEWIIPRTPSSRDFALDMILF